MLSKLFKPRWQHKNPEVRCQAIDKLNAANESHQSILANIALNDAETDVRRLAISKINSLQTLSSVLTSSVSDSTQQFVSKRINTLIEEDPSQQEVLLQLVNNSTDTQVLAALIAGGHSPGFQQKLIENCQNEDCLLQIACSAPMVKTRQLAAEKLRDPQLLEKLAKSSKGHDKTLHRIARDRLQSFKKNIKQNEKVQQVLVTLCEKAESLSQSAYTPLLPNQLIHFQQQWQEAQGQHGNLNTRFQQAIEACQTLIDLQANQASTTDIDDDQQHQNELTYMRQEQICNEIEALQTSTRQADMAAQLNLLESSFPALLTEWDALVKRTPAHPIHAMRFNKIERTLKQLKLCLEKLDQIEKQQLLAKLEKLETLNNNELNNLQKKLHKLLDFKWPDELPVPEALKNSYQYQTRLALAIDSFSKRQQAALQSLEITLASIDSLISNGAVNEASKKLRTAFDQLQLLEKNEARNYEGKLQLLGGRISELRDWQGFAATPKKLELCEAIEKLLETELPPPNKASAIKDLREQWKSLKGTRSDEENALWERFNMAANQAFEPCKIWFAEQDEIKRNNLEQRNYICEQLELFHHSCDWANADWKAVNKIIDTAKREFRQFSPVDNRANKQSQQRFTNALTPVREKLQAEQERNENLKASLLETMQGLLEQGNLDEAIDQAKSLQSQWKTIGITRRNKDQLLWEKFQKAANAVFERRELMNKARSEKAIEELQISEQLVEQIETLANAEIDILRESRSQYQALKTRFREFSALDRKNHNAVFSAFDQACKHYEKSLSMLDEKQFMADLDLLAKKALLCEQLENAVSSPDSDRLLEHINQQWQTISPLPESMHTAIEQRFSQAKKALTEKKSPDYINNKNHLRSILIELEILLGKESPESDKTMRMDIQMNALSETFGKNQQDNTDKIRQLYIDWYCHATCGSMVQIQMNERFQSLRS